MSNRVYVYWNLHKDLFSVRKDGRVRRHANLVQLRNVKFSVSEAGRQRVLASKNKNVHAGLRGDDCATSPEFKTRGWRRITYDPYRFDHFVTVAGERSVVGAEELVGKIVGGRARLYARGLEYA